jgi:hypothetical protein
MSYGDTSNWTDPSQSQGYQMQPFTGFTSGGGSLDAIIKQIIAKKQKQTGSSHLEMSDLASAIKMLQQRNAGFAGDTGSGLMGSF